MNNRPDFVTEEDTIRWDLQIELDNIPKAIVDEPILVEVIYAGLYLIEQLRKLQCPEDYIFRIQYTAGAASFGRDPWEIHLEYLEAYRNNDLEFDADPDNLN
jgi:hypothetical protein